MKYNYAHAIKADGVETLENKNSHSCSENFLNSQENLQKKTQNFNFKAIDLGTLKENLVGKNTLSDLDLEKLSDTQINKIARELTQAHQAHIDLERRKRLIENLLISAQINNAQKSKNLDELDVILASNLSDFDREISYINFSNHPLFIKGAVQMISANPGACKTTFVSDMCATIIMDEMLKKDEKEREFTRVIHIDPESAPNAYKERNQAKIKELIAQKKWHFVDANVFKDFECVKDVNGYLHGLFAFKNLSSTIIFIDSYGVMIDRNDNASVTEFLTICQSLANNSGATIIITTHNNKGGQTYTGGASNQQYVSLFYQLHTINRPGGVKALLLECTKSRYGVMYSYTQGYELDFSKPCGDDERYTIIDDDEVSELIKSVYEKPAGVRTQKSDEVKRLDEIEQIHAILLDGAKTATQIAKAMGKPNNYAQRVLKPILEKWQGVRWIKIQEKDEQGRTREFYRVLQKDELL